MRCQRTGQTDIPGGFSRLKERQGKQGKVKKGRLRNLYRFVRVERWEVAEGAAHAAGSAEDVQRLQAEQGSLLEASEEEREDEDAESRLSFHYEGDDPQPSQPRNFKTDWRSPTPTAPPRAKSSASKYRSASASGHSPPSTRASATGVVRDEAKFGHRMRNDGPVGRETNRRVTTPLPGTTSVASRGGGFDRPTVASMARAKAVAAAIKAKEELPQDLPVRPGTPGPGRRAMSLGTAEEAVPFPRR